MTHVQPQRDSVSRRRVMKQKVGIMTLSATMYLGGGGGGDDDNRAN